MNTVLKCRAARKHEQQGLVVLVTGGWRAVMAVWEYEKQQRHHPTLTHSSSYNS